MVTFRIYANTPDKGANCYVLMAEVVTRIRHIVTYTHFLSCWNHNRRVNPKYFRTSLSVPQIPPSARKFNNPKNHDVSPPNLTVLFLINYVNGRLHLGVHKVSFFYRGAQIFRKSRSHLKILGARRVIWSKLHREDPQILGATVQNVVAKATWHAGSVHPSIFIEVLQTKIQTRLRSSVS